MEKTQSSRRLRSLMLMVWRGPFVYPFLFAVFPILFLWGQNVEELPFSEPLEILVPLAISIGFTIAALVSAGLILRDTRKAGLLVFLFLLSFYSYGHVYTILQDAGIVEPSRQWFFFLSWASLTVFAGLLTLLIKARLGRLTNCLNVTSGLLVMMSLVNIVTYTLGSWTQLQDHGNKESGAFEVAVSNTNTLPDIYYIVPDSYASSQILRDLGYDNSDFTDYLTGKGFFVAHESNSNYMYTEMSLASSLNMRYLTDIEGGMPGRKSWASFLYRDMIDDGRVINTLRSLGYTIIHTRSKSVFRGDSRSQIICDRSWLTRLEAGDFAGTLLGTTALYPVLRYFNVVERQIWNQRLCEFLVIVDVKDIEGPKFVYSLLSVPHPPYIFDRNGLRDPASLSDTNYLDPQEYVDQVVFVNKKLKEIIDGLLSGRDKPLIIIIQSDHGTRATEPKSDSELYRVRFGILNAYYLPHGGNDLLYESISPVNTFRVIFSHYFGADYELLEDRSYYTDRPFSGSNHLDVTGLISK